MYFVLLHASDNVLKNLGLHSRLLEPLPHRYHLIFFADHQVIGLLTLLLHGLGSALQEVDVLSLQLQHTKLPGRLLCSLITVFPDATKVLSHDSGLIQFACGSHLY